MILKIAVVLLFVVVSSEAIVCLPNFCEMNNCTSDVQEGESCPSGLVKMDTFCGCCAKCVEGIGRCETCFLLSGSPSPPCAQGLTCTNNRCEPSDMDDACD